MELLFFRLKNCPYCIAARKWIDELYAEHPEFAKISIREVDEQVERALADSYDYYYVPTFFLGDKKLHEGAATKEKLLKMLSDCMAL